MLKILDVLLSPFVIFSAITLKMVRRIGLQRLSVSKNILLKIGVIPVRNHYYEPFFDYKYMKKPFSDERKLSGINWNINEQLQLLDEFGYEKEFETFSDYAVNDTTFHFKNGSFESGDAEYWYNIIRLKKPKKIIEIGSGHSTKMAQLAIKENSKLDTNYTCKHICIEPYEMPWLEKLDIEVIRKRVEDIDVIFFRQLEANDILFIDSSHVIRPQGDVLFEYLELLPILNKGVIVHIHDIFSPRDYLESWLRDRVIFWNEQYILEAFLTSNSQWKILGALNYLKHNHFEKLATKCPRLTPEREPGSFFIIKTA